MDLYDFGGISWVSKEVMMTDWIGLDWEGKGREGKGREGRDLLFLTGNWRR